MPRFFPPFPQGFSADDKPPEQPPSSGGSIGTLQALGGGEVPVKGAHMLSGPDATVGSIKRRS
jgi:hypothetical protein